MKRILKSEAGQALPMALILLVVGGLLVGTSVSLMHTNLKANIMVDRKTSELYAADAGVEEVLWNIQYKDGFTLPENGDAPQLIVEDLDLNEKTVDAYISKQASQPYKITSTATGDDGNSTTIECYISLLDFSWLFDSAITSPTKITLKPGTHVYGPKTCPLEEGQTWPEVNDLSDFYLEQDDLSPYSSSSIDIEVTKSIGDIKTDGSLSIDNTGDPDTLQLTGTIYVTGDLAFEQSGSHTYTIDLNGQTIFAYDGDSEGENENKATIEFASGCTIMGSGCIIAEGDITFSPSATSGDEDFIFIMSIEGTSTIQPGSTFYGSVAGDTEVYLAPHCSLTLTDVPEDGLNFPGSGSGSSGPLEILTYTIDPS